MNSITVSRFLVLAMLLAGGVQPANAKSVSIGRTPILTATLPANATYQAEVSTNGTSWVPTGALIAGNGASTSVRLDGFPNGEYRLSPVGGGSVVSAVVEHGLHVGASFPGANEVRMESVNTVESPLWRHRAFAFANLSGEFVSPVITPLASNAFFRAVQPATPLVPATITFYEPDTNNTGAGYGIVADDMPLLYRDSIASLCPAAYHRGGTNSAAAGECYELVGPQGKRTVIVADLTPSSAPGTCDIGRPYFDVSTQAFTNLFGTGPGYGIATYRLVPAPVNGKIKMVCINNSGGYYVELRPYNHLAGVIKLEVQGAGGSWVSLPRTDYNSFIYNSGTPLAFPFNTRITSRFGEQIAFPAISTMTNGSRFTAHGQFSVFPDQDPSPVWILPPVYADALTNVLGATWTTAPYGGATVNPTYSGSVYQGSHSLRISSMGGFGGVTFTSPLKFPGQTNAYFEFAVRSEGAAIDGLVVQFQGLDAAGASAQSTGVKLPAIDGTWRVFRIPLAPAMTPSQITQFLLFNSTSAALPAINLDAIAFRW